MPRAEQAPRRLTVVAHEIGPFGGMESQLAELVTRLLDRGVEVRAIGRRIELPAHERLTTVEIAGPRRPFPIAYLWFFLFGSIVVARRRSGVVYTMGAIVANRVDAAKVPFCHAAWAREPGRATRASGSGRLRRINAWVAALLSRAGETVVYRPSRCGKLVAMSRSGAAELDELFPAMRPARVIPNGVELERFIPDPAARRQLRAELGVAENQPVAIFLGGDWRRKGLPQVIDAIAKQPSWQLIVAGRGDVDSMTRQAQQLGVAGRVHFVGPVSEPERYLAAADALTMPSTYEPWGNAALEACASGLPVVVAQAHGVRDFVEDERSGLIVDCDPMSIASALVRLEDRELRTRLGNRACELAADFSLEKVADGYEKLLFGRAQAAVTPRISQTRGAVA
ncbi:MAG: glycosyltransferase family 4 protein [Thermoleophilaceae bacterium]|nr:glycosyltransferase family 4 protein [Thermoleophilaceae bacterium]